MTHNKKHNIELASKHAERLLLTLNKLSIEYGHLLTALQNESKALSSHATEEIIKIANDKEGFLLKIRVIDENRRSLIGVISRIVKADKELTIKELACIFDKRIKNELLIVRKKLLLKIEAANELNKKNKAVMDRLLNCFNEYFDYFRGLILKNDTYLSQGDFKTTDGRGSFISKEV